jgi:calcineurin-like phosphoesterase family protein
MSKRVLFYMRNIFIVSDTHFGHEATCTKFKNADGTPLRPFANADEMNDEMITRWNETVRPDDHVIHLGDVVMSHRFLPIVGRLNGTKELIQGNHDPIGGKRGRKFDFGTYFERVMAMKVFDDMIMTHIPIHPSNIGRWGTNVHGHLHGTEVMQEVENYSELSTFGGGVFTEEKPDPRYLCVSVEHTDFRPIPLDEVRLRIQERRLKYGYVEPIDPYGNGSSEM